MKSFFMSACLLLLFIGNSYAGCMRPFTLSAIGSSESEALQKIQLQAFGQCGNDEFVWASLSRILNSKEVEVDGVIMIKTQAQYRCCFTW